jgi:hypothetical protein
VDWPTTEAMIRKARENLRDILPQRVSAQPAA